MKKISVLIVDDSAVFRKVFSSILSREKGIMVVGEASNPYEARDKILALKPDILTLDIDMPLMDGLTFLEKLMKHHPLPVIIVSAIPNGNATIALKSLECGAVEFIAKPVHNRNNAFKEFSTQLIEEIKSAAKARIRYGKNSILQNAGVLPENLVRFNKKIIAIGASTGGTEALRSILRRTPPNSPPILVVQHMPEKFTRVFAESLNKLCAIQVREAREGDIVKIGLALIAPGNWHMKIEHVGISYFVSLDQTNLVCLHRPSVEVLFNSVAKYAGLNAIGVLMTGMGADGARGLLNMKNNGAKTIAQDEESSVVFGMPKEAIKLGAVNKVTSLKQIPETILSML